MKSLYNFITEAKLNGIKEGETYYCWSSEFSNKPFKIVINKIEKTPEIIVGYVDQNRENIGKLYFDVNFSEQGYSYFNASAFLAGQDTKTAPTPVLVANSIDDIKEIVASKHAGEISKLQKEIAKQQEVLNKLNKELNSILAKATVDA